jgi:hypothetical protein
MAFFTFGLGIIIASQNLQIDITQRVLYGWAFFCVGFKSQVGPKHGQVFSLGFDRQDVPTHAWTWHSLPWVWETRCTQAWTWPCLTWVCETRWTQASTIFRSSCDACWLKNFIPLNRFTWLLIKLDFASDQCMRFGGWQKGFQHLNTIRLMPGIIEGKKGPKWYYDQQAPFYTMKWDQYWSCWAWSMSFCPVLADSSRAYWRA